MPDIAVGAGVAGPRLRALAIRFAAGAADLPGDLAGRFLVLVRGAASTDAALAGLDAARADLLDLGPAMLSPVVLSPDGPLLRVGSLDIGEDALQTVPDVVSAALARCGVDDADVDLFDGAGPLDGLDRVPNAVVLRLFPPPAGPDGRLPLAWLEIAADWVLGDATAEEPVAVRLLGAPFEVTGRDAAATLHAAVAARTWCDLVQGRLDRRIRTASLTFGHAPHLTLATGGPGCNTKALLARFALLEEVARDVPATYACLDLEETFAGIGTGVPGRGWPAHGGAAPNAVAAQLGDVAVPDAFPFQVLGPGHLDRVKARGHEHLEGEVLEDGRLVVVLGDPDDWLPRFERRSDAVERATKALKDLLVTDAELATLARARPHDAVTGPQANGNAHAAARPRARTLEAVPHPRRGLRLTLLELASWLGHEPHSDAPHGVSPVLAAYARWFASGLDQDARQQLKPTRPAWSAPAGRAHRRPVASAAHGRHRPRLAGHRLAGPAQAPAWLRGAGFADAADRLEALGRPTAATRERQLAEVLDPERGDPTAVTRPTRPLRPASCGTPGKRPPNRVAGSRRPKPPASTCPPTPRVRRRAPRESAPGSAHAAAPPARTPARPMGPRPWSQPRRGLAVAEPPPPMPWSGATAAAIQVIDLRARPGDPPSRRRRAAIDRAGIDEEQFELSMEAGDRAAHAVLAEAGRRPRARGGKRGTTPSPPPARRRGPRPGVRPSTSHAGRSRTNPGRRAASPPPTWSTMSCGRGPAWSTGPWEPPLPGRPQAWSARSWPYRLRPPRWRPERTKPMPPPTSPPPSNRR